MKILHDVVYLKGMNRDEEKKDIRTKGIKVIETDGSELYHMVAKLLSEKKIIVWCRGRMEFGPRALGCRSIIACAEDLSVSQRLNEIKRRALYRPLAPSVLAERFEDFFEGDADYYMNKVAYVKDIGRLVGCAHKDNSARVQLVERTGEFYPLLKALEGITGVPVILNTSLNLKGVPIARDNRDAMHIFDNLNVDAAVIGDTILI